VEIQNVMTIKTWKITLTECREMEQNLSKERVLHEGLRDNPSFQNEFIKI
jgi:hypothetical protein